MKDDDTSLLVDAAGIMAWLGVTRHVAETIIERVPVVRLGRRVYVERADVLRLIDASKVSRR